MIHREGFLPLLITAGAGAIVYWMLGYLSVPMWALDVWLVASLMVFVLVLQFFRNPSRSTPSDERLIIAPCDGKVVVMEEVEETEYFNDKRIQISIFMSPLNVHVNRNPISGIVKKAVYHQGKYLVAWHPKSSTENERTTLVIEHATGVDVLFRQIAGAVARRIRFYIKEGQPVKCGEEMGFIKFGSRMDVFLPLGTSIDCKLGDITKGGETILARFD